MILSENAVIRSDKLLLILLLAPDLTVTTDLTVTADQTVRDGNTWLEVFTVNVSTDTVM